MQIFSETSVSELREKSKLLTTYLEYLLLTRHGQSVDQKSTLASSHPYVRIITPSDPEQRGSQLSIWVSVHSGAMFNELARRGVVVMSHRARACLSLLLILSEFISCLI